MQVKLGRSEWVASTLISWLQLCKRLPPGKTRRRVCRISDAISHNCMQIYNDQNKKFCFGFCFLIRGNKTKCTTGSYVPQTYGKHWRLVSLAQGYSTRNLESVKEHLNVRTAAHTPIPCTHTRIVAILSQVSEEVGHIFKCAASEKEQKTTLCSWLIFMNTTNW